MKRRGKLWDDFHWNLAAVLMLGAVPGIPAQEQTLAPAASQDHLAASSNQPPDPTSTPSASLERAGSDPLSTSGTHDLLLNFRGAPLKLVLEYLSDAAGFVIDQQAEVQGAFDVWSKDPVSRQEAVELLNSTLKHHGYGAVRNGRILTIVPLDNIKTADLDVVTGNNPDGVAKSDEVVTQIIPVRYATASQLVNNLQPLLPASASLSVNESANSLILVASKKEIRRVLKIVSALDNSIATVSSLKVFGLRYADAKQLAPVLQQLFSPQNSSANGNQRGQFFNFSGPGGFGPPGFGNQQPNQQNGSGTGSNSAGSKVLVTADEPSNSLIVSSPAGLLSSISNIVAQIDQPVTEITELRVFKLRNADPGEMAEQLSQLFPDSSKSSSDQSQPSMRFGPFPGPPGAMADNAGDQSSSERTKKKSQVLAVADLRSGSVLVSAPSTLMPTIAQTIEQLDANPARKEFVQIYDLHNANPQEVQQVMQDLFNRNNTQRTTSANRNSLTGENNPLSTRETQQQNTMNPGTAGTGAGSPTGQRGATGTTGF